MRSKGLILALCIILQLMLSGCAGLMRQPEPPHVTLTALEPLDLTLFEQRFRLILRLQNPNDFELPIVGMDCSVEINQREFAYGVSRQAVTVPAFGEGVMEVTVVSSIFKVLSQIQEWSGESGGLLRYRLSGGVSLAGGFRRIPFEYRGEFRFTPPQGVTGGAVPGGRSALPAPH